MSVPTISAEHVKGPRLLGRMTWLGVAFVALVAVLAGVGALGLLHNADGGSDDPLAGLVIWAVYALAFAGAVPAIMTTLGLAVSWWWPRATAVLVTASAVWIGGCFLLWSQFFAPVG